MDSIQKRTPAQQFLGDLFSAGYTVPKIKKHTDLTNRDLDQIRRGSEDERLFTAVFIAWCKAWPYVNVIHTQILRGNLYV